MSLGTRRHPQVGAPTTPVATTDPPTRRERNAPTPRRGRRWRRPVRTMVLFVVGALTAGVLLVLSPLAVGGRASIVVSGSMEPTLGIGDVLLAVPVPAELTRVGDIVVFSDPDDPARQVSHRVERSDSDGVEVAMRTRGDANSAPESWSVDADATLGRGVLRVPWIGVPLAGLRDVAPTWTLLLTPAVLFLLAELRHIWRGDPADARRQR